jgi:hypothetical protein
LLGYAGYTANSIEGNDWGLYVEDCSPVHGTKKKLVKAKPILAIPSHDQLASSPNLNPIKNVWRMIKQKIKAYPRIPYILDEMKATVQEWDKLEPTE